MEGKRGCPGGRKAMEAKRDALLFDKPPVGLAPAEAELAATKAAAGFFSLSFFRLEGGRKRMGGGRNLVAEESWPRRHKADGGQEQMPRRREADGGQEGCPGGRKAMEGKRDALLFDKPPVGLAPAEAELAATKAAAGFFSLSFFRPEGGRKTKGPSGRVGS
jgi:hypothetical protein